MVAQFILVMALIWLWCLGLGLGLGPCSSKEAVLNACNSEIVMVQMNVECDSHNQNLRDRQNRAKNSNQNSLHIILDMMC